MVTIKHKLKKKIKDKKGETVVEALVAALIVFMCMAMLAGGAAAAVRLNKTAQEVNVSFDMDGAKTVEEANMPAIHYEIVRRYQESEEEYLYSGENESLISGIKETLSDKIISDELADKVINGSIEEYEIWAISDTDWLRHSENAITSIKDIDSIETYITPTDDGEYKGYYYYQKKEATS